MVDFRARPSRQKYRLLRAFALEWDDGWDALFGRFVLAILGINLVVDMIEWFA